MRIGLVEFLLILALASLTVGPQVALFVDRWMRRANRVKRPGEHAAGPNSGPDGGQSGMRAQAVFRTASTVFGVGILLALVVALVFGHRHPPQAYTAPEVRQSTGAVQTALSATAGMCWH